jgi:Lrp/AsnC family transcriptional regulator, leucine-responsive regulatory protein
MDAVDQQILTALRKDGRATYDAIAAEVKLSAPAIKRRVDRLKQTGAIQGFTVIVDHHVLGAHTEALIEMFFAPGTQLDTVAEKLRGYPEVLEAWSITGEADAIARVRTNDNTDLERLIRELQRDGVLQRTRSQVVMSRLVSR